MTIRELIDNGTITLETEVLGTLPKTKDGVIALNGQRVYHPDVDESCRLTVLPMRELDNDDNRFPLPDDCEWVASYWYYEQDTGYSEFETYDIRECYSTPEVARAAKGGGAL